MTSPFRRQTLLPTLLSLLLVSSSAWAQVEASKAARFYEDALRRYENRDISGSIVQLKNALQADKKLLPVHVLLGKALLANGEAVNAELAFTEALRLGVNRAEVVLPLARAVAAQGNQRQVLEQPRFALAGLPSFVQLDLLLIRSAAASDVGDAAMSLKELEQARAIDPRLPEVWLAEVPIRIRARQFREANVAADKGMALNPRSAEAWYQKGSISHVQGNLPAALSAYEKALRADENHIEARIARAGVNLDLGLINEARADIKQLVQVAPQEPRGAYLTALMAERDGDAAASRVALKQVTDLLDVITPDFLRYRPQLLMLNGLAHFGLNEREKAKPYLELFQRAQNNSPVSKLLAQIYLSENNADRAIEVLEVYTKNRPGDGHAMSLLAGAYMAKGRHAKATALMQEALRTRDTPEFRTVLGISMIGTGQTGNALPELEGAFKRDPQQVQAGVALVSLYLRDGQTAKATVTAQALVKQQPGNPSYFNLLGVCKAQARDWTGARAAFDQALKLDADFMQAKLGLARVDIAANELDAATRRLNEILKLDTNSIDAMYDMAVLMERRGQLAEAQRWLEKAVDLSSQRETRANFALVELHLRSGRPGPALDAAKRLLAKRPEDVGALIAYARAQLANGDTAGARTSLTNASRRADYDAPTQHNIAVLQISAKDLAGAAYSLEKALTGKPDFLPAQALMSGVDLGLGDAAKAEKRARQIIQSAPKNAIGYNLLADVSLAANQPAAALDSLRRAHELQPSSTSVSRLFALLSSDVKSQPQAFALADKWLASHPSDLAVRKTVADAYARAGNSAAARKAYEGMLKLAPNDAEVLNNLANLLLQAKDPAATALAEKALALAPNNANIIDTAGWANHLAGKNDRALQLLRDARLREPANPVIRYHLATVLAKTGRSMEAREELTAALRTTPQFEGSVEAAALLQTLK